MTARDTGAVGRASDDGKTSDVEGSSLKASGKIAPFPGAVGARQGQAGNSVAEVLPLNLYRLARVGALLRSPHPQRAAQLVLFGAYLGLFLLGWGRDAIPGIPELHPRMYTHATPLLLWVAWFMGLVVLAPLVGRAWCAVCPLGLLSDGVGRRGLGMSWPAWLRSGPAVPLLFVAGVGAVVWGEAHKSPHRTAVLIACVAAIAVVSGILWRRSGFCRGLCPVGAVLQLYSRHAPVAIRPVDASVCGGCEDRSCTNRQSGWYHWGFGNVIVQRRVSRSGCPVALDPPTMDPTACLLCLRCVRRCSRGNLGVFWGRRPEAPPLRGPQVALVVLLAGLLCIALLRTWPAARDWLTPGVTPPLWVSYLWLGAVVPALVVAAPGALWAAAVRFRGIPVEGQVGPGASPTRVPPREGMARRPALGRFAAAFVGPVLGAHAVLALVKLNAKAGYLPYLIYDPMGSSTYLAIHVARTLPLPDLVVPLSGLRWLALACLAIGAVAGVREALRLWRRDRGPAWLYAVSFAGLTGLYGASVVHWLFPWGR